MLPHPYLNSFGGYKGEKQLEKISPRFSQRAEKFVWEAINKITTIKYQGKY